MIGFTGLAWVLSGMGKKFVVFTLKLMPFLVIIGVVSLFPSFNYARSAQMALRYVVMLGSTMLIMSTMSYEQMSNAIRHLRIKRFPKLNTPLEIFALTFGLSFSTVPIAAEEWHRLKEIQRSRGVDIDKGNMISQVKNGLAMLQPLALRVFKRIEGFAKTIIVSGYDFNVDRTFFHPLNLSVAEKVTTISLLGTAAISVFLTSVLKV